MFDIKEKVKHITYIGKPISSQKLIKEIFESDVKVISYDIFDTLLKRNVDNPTRVFEIIENEKSLNSFRENRINAEK